jgi:cytochrome c peroxidase
MSRMQVSLVLFWFLSLPVLCWNQTLNQSTKSLAAFAGDRRLSSADPEVKLGDRLFFETRFAEYFYEHHNGDVNAPLAVGDPIVKEVLISPNESLRGPFRGQSMSCRQCHLGDDFIGEYPLAGRTYCDFSRRSAIPARHSERATTARNSPLMPDLGLARDVPVLFHFDGEFATVEDLVTSTLTGANFGWRPDETNIAASHIGNIIRRDNGINPRFVVNQNGDGIPYRVALLGTDPNVPIELRIPAEYQLDVESASDGQVLYAVGKLIHAYMDSLRFGTDNTFRTSVSPYDLFLKKNSLPNEPKVGESASAYADRLLKQINKMKSYAWVAPDDATFVLHAQRYQFGPSELRGLRIFFRQQAWARQHTGNCITCHSPPQFTDHRFHNTGASQMEYDSIFGKGTFAALRVPSLAERNANFEKYLPPSATHPRANARFRAAPTAEKPGYVDVGVWNILGNPDLPKPQQALLSILCTQRGISDHPCTQELVLPLTIAYFKTPSLRDLGQSSPYLHTGALDTIEDVVRFYIVTSHMARIGTLRNASPELSGVHIDNTDLDSLILFLKSLNEDYH